MICERNGKPSPCSSPFTLVTHASHDSRAPEVPSSIDWDAGSRSPSPTNVFLDREALEEDDDGQVATQDRVRHDSHDDYDYSDSFMYGYSHLTISCVLKSSTETTLANLRTTITGTLTLIWSTGGRPVPPCAYYLHYISIDGSLAE